MWVRKGVKEFYRYSGWNVSAKKSLDKFNTDLACSSKPAIPVEEQTSTLW